MNSKVIILFALFNILLCKAQTTNTFPNNGNVGIGTINPTEKLEVNGTIKASSFSSFGTTFNSGGIYSNNYNIEIISTVDEIYLSSPYAIELQAPVVYFSNNVGIGTASPEGKLDIRFGGFGNIPRVVFKSNSENPGINFYRPTGSGATAYPWRIEENLGALEFQTGSNANIGSETLARKFYIDNSKAFFTDNLGIGTENPTEKLQVQGNIKNFGDIYSFGDINSYRLNNEIGGKIGFETHDIFLINSQKVAHYGMSRYNNENSQPTLALSGYFGTTFHTNGGERMRITQDGKIGIGTKNPDAKLTINGDIHAKEIKIDLAIAPDYVFEKYYDGYSTLKSDYKMPTLQEVEAFTKENKHLPEVPSAQEIKENGLKLGEMNAILLQKVEELTLYLIEQNKEIEKLKAKEDLTLYLIEQNKEIEKLRAKVDELLKQ